MPCWGWLVDLALIDYTAASIIGWRDAGKPNPQDLGYLLRGVEAALIVLLVGQIGLVTGLHPPAARFLPRSRIGPWNA